MKFLIGQMLICKTHLCAIDCVIRKIKPSNQPISQIHKKKGAIKSRFPNVFRLFTCKRILSTIQLNKTLLH